MGAGGERGGVVTTLSRIGQSHKARLNIFLAKPCSFVEPEQSPMDTAAKPDRQPTMGFNNKFFAQKKNDADQAKPQTVKTSSSARNETK